MGEKTHNFSVMIGRIVSKLSEYGLEVFEHHYTDKNETEYVLMVEKMILVYNPIEKSLQIAFLVSVLPHEAARWTLILKSVKGLKKVGIMEPFIFDTKDGLLSGDQAVEVLEKYRKEDIINKFVQEQEYIYMLYSHNYEGEPC